MKSAHYAKVVALFSCLGFYFIDMAVNPTFADGLLDDENLTISATEFAPRSAPGEMLFTRHDGSTKGLSQPNLFTPRDFYPPFFNGGGIASGDINRDGWPDIVSAVGPLIVLHINQQGRQFQSIEIDVTGQSDTAIFNIALVDINSDGWLDLFGTTYLQGNFYLLSDNGQFTSSGLRQAARGNAVLSSTASFGDIDRDGDLDAVIGNWFAGASKKHPPSHSQNEVWINDNDRFSPAPLNELVGETLSTLLSDWSGDGILDLVVGNDFDAPDFYYRGVGNGEFELITRDDDLIPHSTHSTMSVDSADFDNDLDLDIFIDQITARATGPSAEVQMQALEKYCDDIATAEVKTRCLANMATREGFFYGANHRPSNVRNCADVPDEADRQSCIGMQVMMTAQRVRKPEFCDAIPDGEVRTANLCRNFFETTTPYDATMLASALPQQMNQNVLLKQDAASGRFEDIAESVGVGFTGWSWNARFADIDNDEWQDIFVVAGSWFRATPSGTTANFFFHNQRGKTFVDKTDDFGFQNFMIVSAYTTVDYDRDGDLDFVTNSINGPLWLLQNNSQSGNSIAFQLQDKIGNYDGIGSKIFITYGDDGTRQQVRELKSSGGYLSFDEPIAYFGLGDNESVSGLRIQWSTGETSYATGPFRGGKLYTIARPAAETD